MKWMIVFTLRIVEGRRVSEYFKYNAALTYLESSTSSRHSRAPRHPPPPSDGHKPEDEADRKGQPMLDYSNHIAKYVERVVFG